MTVSPANSKTILVIEDEIFTASVITRILENNHFKVIKASNGAEALKKLTSGIIPHLILLDVMMPKMDGFEFLKMFNQNKQWNDISVIMLTALSDSDDVLKALKLGAKDYCVKPLDPEDVLNTINKYIAQ